MDYESTHAEILIVANGIRRDGWQPFMRRESPNRLLGFNALWYPVSEEMGILDEVAV
jgi:hypothetical protein